MTCKSPSNVSNTLKRCMFVSAIFANFQPKFYVGSTSSFVLDREHSRYRKFLQVQQSKFVLAEVALRFWCRFDNFWMWSVFRSTPTIQFLGFGTSLNSTVATSIEYSVYLSIFQLPEGTHPADQVFGFPPVWILLVVAQTTMEVHPYTSTAKLYRVPYLVAEFSFGKSSKTLVAIRSRDFTWKTTPLQ